MKKLTREEILNSEAFKEIALEIACEYGISKEFSASDILDFLKNKDEEDEKYFNRWKEEGGKDVMFK